MFCGCNEHVGNESFRQKKEKYKIEKVGFLAKEIDESSGLEMGNTDSTFFTMNDDTQNEIFEVNKKGKLLKTFPIVYSSNIDWEDLTKDDKGNLYIGDVGNNNNARQNLKFYVTNLQKQNDSIAEIAIQYEDQSSFPPSKKELTFDCEAFFWYQDSLYLFSKNRGNHTEKMYVIPAKPGKHVAKLAQTTKLKGMVTAADISPDGTKFALLTYGYIYLFDIVDKQINFKYPRTCIKFSRAKQAEGLVFVNNNDMLITNENRYMFLVRKK